MVLVSRSECSAVQYDSVEHIRAFSKEEKEVD